MHILALIVIQLIEFVFIMWCIANLVADNEDVIKRMSEINHRSYSNRVRCNELEKEIECLKETVDSLIQEVG